LRAGLVLSALALALLLGEFLYFRAVYARARVEPPAGCDLVLVYSGSGDLEKGVQWALQGRSALFYSGDDKNLGERWRSIPPALPHWWDPKARTTDQNARYSAPFIRQRGFRRVALLTRWDHIPRALFLTRLYLWGAGVELTPCVNTPVPPDWWRRPAVCRQLVQFWGSLGRIVLDAGGVEDWPPPQWWLGRY
jgi:uncharacterized SAM-binding protein YcdF (DUF218 family)